ncbi:MAG: PilZ domain-containing protein [Candidatus Omnitrophica bacterium]|nr:PilZ domain-containing protein [Candidatus Omnitrophota bacterium]MBU2044481.1 PilZ domain-containing protein [Candidatus Omnitrophota bacterium]MBU2266057.1 PilZ domain-containing protein [Candidatus Omnitrophota bacterium]MBU2474111.1 PilZ domain-containing protein [Candidatus Omnitrophota bacterium]
MNERRKEPRIDKIISVKLSDSEFDILTETKNISASGAYCPVSKPIQPMTKLRLVLLLPVKKNRSTQIKKISCEGVVVRLENINDNAKYPYRAGIFFSTLSDADKKSLRCYIQSSLK